MSAQTPAERKRAEREAKRKVGLVPGEVWARPDDWPAIRDYVAKLNDETPAPLRATVKR